ncbi:MAG TPA: histidine kinase [Mycobacteriales bacterium]|nr:histidine kinase [Mycobacteriales bacterium]
MAEEPATRGDASDAAPSSKVGYLLRQATETLINRGRDGHHTQVQLRALLNAVLSLSEDLSLLAIVDRTIESACELVHARTGAIAVLAGDGSTVTDVIGRNLSADDEARIRAGSAPAEGIAVPLRTRNRLFGHLHVASKEGTEGFTEADELMVVALTSAAGAAIQNAQLFETQERRGLWLVASSEIRSAVLGGAREDRLGELAVAEARQAARAIFAALVLPHPDGGMVVSAATDPAIVGNELEAGTSFAEQVTVSREPVVLENIDQGHPATGFPPTLRARSGRCVIAPLGVGEEGQGLGALVVVYPVNEAGVAELNLDYVVGFAGQAGVALQLAATHQDRERIAVLEDRERIARDLHDLVIQRLFAAGMTLQSTDSLIADESARARLAAVADDLDGTIRELRQAIYQLQTPVIADDFRHQVQQVVDRGTAGSTVKVRVRYAGPVGTLVADEARPHVLAVIGEALSNAIRHAGAATVDVAVGLEDGSLSVVVDDDGRGIDPAVGRRSGLANLESRALELGGQMVVGGGSRGVGTRISWSVPA